MSIQCPECNAKLKATAEHAGRTLKCPRCGEPVTVPRDLAVSRELAKEPPPLKPTDEGTSPVSEFLRRQVTMKATAIAVAVALVLGFFAGREEMKAEMRAAIVEAFSPSPDAAGDGAGSGGGRPKPNPVKPAPEPEPLTIGTGHATDRAAITLVSAKVDFAQVPNSISGEARTTDEKLLILRFQIENRDARRELPVIDSRSSFRGGKVAVFDDVGNEVDETFHDEAFGSLPGGYEMKPSTASPYIGLFEVPLPKTKHIEVRVNLAMIKGDGSIVWKVPADQIAGFQSD